MLESFSVDAVSKKEDATTLSDPVTKHRKRKKKLLKDVQKQLEFYFGDSNLRHDRFMRKEIENDPDGFISISKLLTFNKLKALTSDSDIIKRAVQNSSIIKLNEAEDKIKRCQPLPDLSNRDSCTVYVEHLPAYVTQDWIRDVFSCCGHVEYISLPRFVHNKQIKGFAFVEYSLPEEAERACQLLDSHKSRKRRDTDLYESDSKLDDDGTSKSKMSHRSRSFSGDEKLSKREHFNGDQRAKRRHNLSDSSVGDDDRGPSQRKQQRCVGEASREGAGGVISTDSGRADDVNRESPLVKDCSKQDILYHVGKTLTRKRLSSSGSQSSCEACDISGKKAKLEVSNNSFQMPGLPDHEAVEVQDHESNGAMELMEKLESSSFQAREKSAEKPSNKRKRRRKPKEVKEIRVPPLFVISKAEWSMRKKEYLSLQRKSMSSLKEDLRALRSAKELRSLKAWRKERKFKQQTDGQEQSNDACKTSGDNQHVIDEPAFRAGKDAVGASSEIVPDPKPNVGLCIASGSILSLTTDADSLTRKDIRGTLTPLSVTYVDYEDGSKQGFVRFASMLAAQSAAEQSRLEEHVQSWRFSLRHISAEDEQAYIVKAMEDRQKKLNVTRGKKAGKSKGRGSLKLLEKADSLLREPSSSYIRFEE